MRYAAVTIPTGKKKPPSAPRQVIGNLNTERYRRLEGDPLQTELSVPYDAWVTNAIQFVLRTCHHAGTVDLT